MTVIGGAVVVMLRYCALTKPARFGFTITVPINEQNQVSEGFELQFFETPQVDELCREIVPFCW